MCLYIQAEVWWGAIMLEPHVPAHREGYLLHEQQKHVLKDLKVSCAIQKGWQNDRSQQMITNNSSPDVYGKPMLVNSDEHCMRVLIVPDVAIPAVEVPAWCEAGLISKQDVQGKGRISDTSLVKLLDKLNTGREVAQPWSLHLLEVECM
jgi:hypothetical protein